MKKRKQTRSEVHRSFQACPRWSMGTSYGTMSQELHKLPKDHHHHGTTCSSTQPVRNIADLKTSRQISQWELSFLVLATDKMLPHGLQCPKTSLLPLAFSDHALFFPYYLYGGLSTATSGLHYRRHFFVNLSAPLDHRLWNTRDCVLCPAQNISSIHPFSRTPLTPRMAWNNRAGATYTSQAADNLDLGLGKFAY